MESNKRCPNFKWQMGGKKFTSEMWIIPFEDWDAILKISWLKELGPVTFDAYNGDMQRKREN